MEENTNAIAGGREIGVISKARNLGPKLSKYVVNIRESSLRDVAEVRPRVNSRDPDVTVDYHALQTISDPMDFITAYEFLGNETEVGRDPLRSCLLMAQTQRPATIDSHSVKHFTRYRVQSSLSFTGCRSGYAAAITAWIFMTVKERYPFDDSNETVRLYRRERDAALCHAVVPLAKFMDIIREGIEKFDAGRRFQCRDFIIASNIFNESLSIIILLGGTSGSGKSTLASLLAARLGITTVLSTDSVRHALRSVINKDENPCLFASTYEAGELHVTDSDILDQLEPNKPPLSAKRLQKRRVLKGYFRQSLPVLDKLDLLLTKFEERHKSLIVEGVHLSLDAVAKLMQKHPTVVPFLIYISNEKKHRERFAVRSRNMTLAPQDNKYIKYFHNIQIIQDHQKKMAGRHLIPMVDNTNVDRSIGTLHSTIVRVVRRIAEGASVINEDLKCVVLSREFEREHQTAWSSKSMRALLKQRVSRNLLMKRLLLESPGGAKTVAGGDHNAEPEYSSSSSGEDRVDGEEEEEAHQHEGSNSPGMPRLRKLDSGSEISNRVEAAEVGSLVDTTGKMSEYSAFDDEFPRDATYHSLNTEAGSPHRAPPGSSSFILSPSFYIAPRDHTSPQKSPDG